jgi:two-component system, OmpR family, sensor kinase
MVQAGRRAGFWQSIRDLPGRTPLRLKLITALLALVALALLVISVAGIAILKNDLLGPVDNSLTSQMNRAVLDVGTFQQTGQQSTSPDLALTWITSKGVVHNIIIPTSGYSGGIGGQGPFGQPQQIPGPSVPTSQAWLSANSDRLITLPGTSGDYRWRVYMVTGSLSNGSTGTVVLAINATSQYTTIGQLETIDLLVSLAVIVLLAVVGITVVRRSLRPLTDIEQTAGAIAAGDLSRRVPERDPQTEVGRLGRSLNVMLSQIETAFHARSQSEKSARRSEEKMRQFVADASHELRTPLTAIRGFAEYYRQRGGVATDSSDSGHLASADLDRIMRRVEQEASRMGILVEDMLLLARLDQQRPLEARPVDLLSLAADAVHDARVVAPDRSINLTVGSGAALLVIGDEVRLRQVIGNLMSNALTHTPDGTPIDVLIRSGNLDEAPVGSPPPPGELDDSTAHDSTVDDAARETGAADGGEVAGGEVAGDMAAGDMAAVPVSAPLDADQQRQGHPAAVLEVTDHGPGLSQEHAEHVFERFYRADQSRTAGGTGLGLAIVAALVTAHGGAAWVRSRPGEGATFCIALPLSPDAVHGSHDDLDAEADTEDMPDHDSPDGDGPHSDGPHSDGLAAGGLPDGLPDGDHPASTARAAPSAASR